MLNHCNLLFQYDLSASQFSPDGRVFQVEYAAKAVENSGTVIGLRGKDGVVFAVEKLVTSKLYEPGANKRIFHVDEHVGMVSFYYLNFYIDIHYLYLCYLLSYFYYTMLKMNKKTSFIWAYALCESECNTKHNIQYLYI